MTIITPASDYTEPDDIDPRGDAQLRHWLRQDALSRQYWKIVAMMRGDGKPSVTEYLLSQQALLDEFRTERTPGADPLERLETIGLPCELVEMEHIVL